MLIVIFELALKLLTLDIPRQNQRMNKYPLSLFKFKVVHLNCILAKTAVLLEFFNKNKRFLFRVFNAFAYEHGTNNYC
jgi:hypothetical protein